MRRIREFLLSTCAVLFAFGCGATSGIVLSYDDWDALLRSGADLACDRPTDRLDAEGLTILAAALKDVQALLERGDIAGIQLLLDKANGVRPSEARVLQRLIDRAVARIPERFTDDERVQLAAGAVDQCLEVVLSKEAKIPDEAASTEDASVFACRE